MGRAFGVGWNSTPCDAGTLMANQVNTYYFDRTRHASVYDTYTQVEVGDVLEFGNGAHVSFVTSKTASDPAYIYVAQVNNQGGQEQTNLTVSTVITGSVPLGVTGRGQPTGYYRKKKLWRLIIQNSFTGGNIGREFGSTILEYASPCTTEWLHWTNYPSQTMVAVMDGRIHEGYPRKFRRWLKAGAFYSSNIEITVPLSSYTPTDAQHTFTAVLVKQYDIVFQNNLVGVGNAGVMKVSGNPENLPHAPFPVYEDATSIQAEAVYHVVNGIEYTFTQWQDGNTSASRTFTPNNHTTYTADYTGRPLNIRDNYSLAQTAGIGEYIRLQWTEHPNAGVTQYQVWRIVKRDGIQYDPALIATVNRGTTSFTDQNFVISNGYTDLLLMYDIRAYYLTEQTFANNAYLTIFGKDAISTEKLAVRIGEKPATFALSNYPNPFNPSTKIDFDLPQDGNVTLAIYDVLGRKVADIASGFMKAGAYSCVWNARGNSDGQLAGGIYVARFTIRDEQGGAKFNKVHKLLFMK